jgi:O-antigen ligase
MQSLTHISKNPILGAGIGNWKILSIKYDSKNIKNYIIPYNAHNDILEATAETGVFGGILFLSFFLIILYYLFELLRKNILSHDDYLPSVLLILTFVVYFIDLNLNFPSSRPVNQFLLLMFMCLVLNYKEEINEKK